MVDRDFRQEPRKVILTDITYLFYGKGLKAYLSAMKDAYTKQILSYAVSESLEVDFVLETVNQLRDMGKKSAGLRRRFIFTAIRDVIIQVYLIGNY